MPHKTSIEWTDFASNPVRAIRKDNQKVGWHCTKVGPECDRCYAEGLNKRFGTQLPFSKDSEAGIEMILDPKEVQALRRFKKPGATVFVCDMTDIFHHLVSDAQLDQLFDVFEATPHFVKQILTKRPERMRLYLKKRWKDKAPPTHIWGGTSVGHQDYLWRVEKLLHTPLAVRFLSCEPLLGPLEFDHLPCPNGCADQQPDKAGPDRGKPRYCGVCNFETPGKVHFGLAGIHWVIVGGESGPDARPMRPDWARKLRNQCQAAGVPFFFKQWGDVVYRTSTNANGSCSWTQPYRIGKKAAGRLLDGREWNEMPEVEVLAQ